MQKPSPAARILYCRHCLVQSCPPYRHFCGAECRAASLAEARARRGGPPAEPPADVPPPPPEVRQQRRLATDDIMRAMRGSTLWNS